MPMALIACPSCGREGEPALYISSWRKSDYSTYVWEGVIHPSDGFYRFCHLERRDVRVSDAERERLKLLGRGHIDAGVLLKGVPEATSGDVELGLRNP